MSLISPSTLIVAQSQPATAVTRPARPPGVLEPVRTPDFSPSRDTVSGGVDIRLSREARAYLSAAADPAAPATATAPPRALAGPAADTRPTAPAGSTLDISV